MGRPPLYDWPQLATDLFDLLAAQPDGMDIHEIQYHLGLTRQHAYRVIRILRGVLGAGDSINVPFKKDGNRAVYFLSGTVDEIQPWHRYRLSDTLSRLETMEDVWRSVVNGTDGRTTDGKVARHIVKFVSRLREDVQEEVS